MGIYKRSFTQKFEAFIKFEMTTILEFIIDRQCTSKGSCCFEVGRILFIYRKNSTKKDKENKTKQRKTMYSEQLYTITILALNKSIQAVQLIY